MLGDSRDPPGSLERARGGHGSRPSGRQGCVTSFHVCVLAPLLLPAGVLPVCPLNSLINISPWTMLHKLALLLCQPLQGMGAQVLTWVLGWHGEPITTA